MSIYVMAPVLRCHVPDVPAGEHHKGSTGIVLKFLLLGLADAANEDGTNAHPGIRTLARYAQCHTATAVRGLRHLESLGAIRRTEQGGGDRSASYDVNLTWVAEHTPCRDCAPGARADEKCAHRARTPRAPEARTLRAPEARSSVFTSVRNGSAPADDADDDSIAAVDPETIPAWVGDALKRIRAHYPGAEDGK